VAMLDFGSTTPGWNMDLQNIPVDGADLYSNTQSVEVNFA
jgi:hypothetical protein